MKTKIKSVFTIMVIVFLSVGLYADETSVKESALKIDKVDSKAKEAQIYMDYINLLDKKYESKRSFFGYVSKLLSLNMDKNIDVEINSVEQKSALASQDQKFQSSNMTIIARKTIFKW